MKARLFAVLFVSAMMLATAAPAFAQAVADDGGNASDDDTTTTDVQYVDCSQVQNAVQNQYGDSTAVADDESIAAAANALGISQNQVNACLGGIGVTDDQNKTPEPDPDPNPNDNRDDRELPEGEDKVMQGTMSDGKLPNTGGPSLAAALAGAALIAGGAVLVRAGRGQ